MSKLLPRIDHIADGLARTISQYRGKPIFNLMCAIYLQQVQYVEDAIHDTVAAWDVDTAVGWRLTALGALVGQQRISSDDDVFRIYVQARIRANRSVGKFQDVWDIAMLLIPGFRYYELSQNCFFEVQSEDLDSGMALAVQQMLDRAAPAGVRVHLTWGNDIDGSFTFAQTAAAEVDAPGGFCDTSLSGPTGAGVLDAGY
jgi:hypothetical protein